MANESASALENTFTLNKLFNESFAPVNNFVAQQTQLSIARQRDLENRARALEDIQTRFEQEKALEAAKDAAAFSRTREEQQGATQRNTSSLASTTSNLELANKLHEQAQLDAENRQRAAILRSDPEVKRIMDTSKFPSSPQGDAALIDAYTKAYTPEVAEKLSTDTLVGLNGEVSRLLQDLGEAPVDKAQSRNAVQKFLADPTVSTALIKKGNLTQEEINSLSNSGDINKVSQVIDEVAKRSGWFGRDDKLLSTLVGALAQARVAATGGDPDQLARADTLKSLLTKRDTLLQKGLINSPEAWKRIHDSMAIPGKQTIKLPPPPVASGLPGATMPRPISASQSPSDSLAAMGLLPALGEGVSAMSPSVSSIRVDQVNPLQRDVNQDTLMRFLFGSPSRFDSGAANLSPGAGVRYIPGTIPTIPIPPDNAVRLNF